MDTPGTPVGRRVVVGMLGLGVLGVVGGRAAQDGVDSVRAAISTNDPSGLTTLIPAAGGFRYYSVASDVARVLDADYRLTVSGLVRQPLRLTLAELRAMPRVTLTRDFQCVTGWRVPGVTWTGVALWRLLDAAGVASAAKAVTLRSFDGVYTESLTLDQARRADVMVAFELAGKPLTWAHGGPARLYAAPMYGYKSCKWLGGVEVTSTAEPGYWERRGYDVDAWVGRSNGRDDAPTS